MNGAIQLQISLDQVQDRTINWYRDCLEYALKFIENESTMDFTSEDLIYFTKKKAIQNQPKSEFGAQLFEN